MPERKLSGIKFDKLPPNEFIPVNSHILVEEKQNPCEPEKIHNLSLLQNGSFKVCKGGIKLSIATNEDTPFKDFYTSYLELLLKELTYNGEVLDTEVEYDSDDKVTMEIFGFNDTALKLLSSIGNNLWKVHEDSEKLF